jgi:hypothetical protein
MSSETSDTASTDSDNDQPDDGYYLFRHTDISDMTIIAVEAYHQGNLRIDADFVSRGVAGSGELDNPESVTVDSAFEVGLGLLQQAVSASSYRLDQIDAMILPRNRSAKYAIQIAASKLGDDMPFIIDSWMHDESRYADDPNVGEDVDPEDLDDYDKTFDTPYDKAMHVRRLVLFSNMDGTFRDTADELVILNDARSYQSHASGTEYVKEMCRHARDVPTINATVSTLSPLVSTKGRKSNGESSTQSNTVEESDNKVQPPTDNWGTTTEASADD